jgi:hypothetical protein
MSHNCPLPRTTIWQPPPERWECPDCHQQWKPERRPDTFGDHHPRIWWTRVAVEPVAS